MKQRCCLAILLWLVVSGQAAGAAADGEEPSLRCALLLHGLARTSWSMRPVGDTLEEAGWRIVNLGYPSRQDNIQNLSAYVGRGFERCAELGIKAEQVDVVTHSMGGLLLRQWVADSGQRLGRAVMLGPPNQGSELVDRLGRSAAFRFYNGPAGLQLGTDADAHWRTLPPVNFELGVIAGRGSENGFLGRHVAAPNDGKVSVASTRVAGMSGHLVVDEGHTFLMNGELVRDQVLQFLRTGAFSASR